MNKSTAYVHHPASSTSNSLHVNSQLLEHMLCGEQIVDMLAAPRDSRLNQAGHIQHIIYN